MNDVCSDTVTLIPVFVICLSNNSLEIKRGVCVFLEAMQDTVVKEIISTCNIESPNTLVIALKLELSPCLQSKVFVLSQEGKHSKDNEKDVGKSAVVWSVQ